MKTITVQDLKKILDTHPAADLIDVRTPGEYASVHVASAVLHPLDSFDCGKVLAARRGPAGSPLFILCHSGARAQKAAARLEQSGCADVVVVSGGTSAWEQAGYPVERGGRAVLPLDRQLQITMGCIVLTGVLLSRFVHPAWIWLSGFVGAGLIVAGSTGLCPMRSLIARMPWNRPLKKDGGGSCCCAG
jgi:rhodanese-related sulfurtransferase